MNYQTAKIIVNSQNRTFKNLKDVRIKFKGYEYRVQYKGGFAAYVAIDRREVGKRNFKYFSGICAVHCLTTMQVLDAVEREIKRKVGE